jgi:hypothetical protein
MKVYIISSKLLLGKELNKRNWGEMTALELQSIITSYPFEHLEIDITYFPEVTNIFELKGKYPNS